jgi:hypothetical protein
MRHDATSFVSASIATHVGMAAYKKQMQKIVEDYRLAGETWPASDTLSKRGKFVPTDKFDGMFDNIRLDAEDFLFDADAVQQASLRRKRGGTVDWAPGPDHPDHREAQDDWERRQQELAHEGEPLAGLDEILRRLEAGARPTGYGDGYEREQRARVIEKVEELRRELEALKPKHGGIGHNNPPRDEDASQVTAVTEVHESTNVISEELGKPEPDALAVATAASRLWATLQWFGKKADAGAEAFVKAFSTTAGTGTALYVGSVVLPPLGVLIAEVVKAAVQWLSYITLAF